MICYLCLEIGYIINMKNTMTSNLWLVFALLSALFAALTSIFAKVGIEGVNSNLATALRTIVVAVVKG